MIYSTKIKWAGSDCILLTSSDNNRIPIAILDKRDIEELLSEW